MARSSGHLETRVAELSAQYHGLSEADRKHEKGLSALAEQVSTGFRELREAVGKGQMTQWVPILMFASFILSAVMFIGFLARQPLVDSDVAQQVTIQREADRRRAGNLLLRAQIDKIRSKVDYIRGRMDATMESGLPRRAP